VHVPDNFVAGNDRHRRFEGREAALELGVIGAADAGRFDPKQSVVVADLREGELGQF